MSQARVVLAAPSSGSGKTLLTCGILLALKKRGMRLSAFKCGPDYVDPLFHREVLGVPSGNLDLFFAQAGLRHLFLDHAAQADLSLVEGVMGYYDGMGAATEEGSTWQIAQTLEAPVLLVVNARGQSLSALASLQGFISMRADSGIRGVIFNQMSERVYEALRPRVAEMGVVPLGHLPRDEALVVESRPLGLLPPAEQHDLRERLERLAGQVEKRICLDRLVQLAEAAPPLSAAPPPLPERREPVTVAVARDEAFCFHYRDNLALLQRLGARLAFFSPMEDAVLPTGTQALLLGGGYPDVHAGRLSGNAAMRQAVREAVTAGMPCLAEGGGFLYLHESLEDARGRVWPMAGVLAARGVRRRQMGRFGYLSLRARGACPYLKDGETVRGHEFRYDDSEAAGEDFEALKPDGRRWLGGVARGRLMAGFAQLYYPSYPPFAARFLDEAARWGRGES